MIPSQNQSNISNQNQQYKQNAVRNYLDMVLI